MISNQFEPDIEEIITFTVALTPAEVGMVLAAVRAYERHNERTRTSLATKHGDDFDPTVSDEKAEVITSIKHKIRKAGYG